MDDHLKWNASEFGNLTQIHMGASEIWKPDILLYNNADPRMRHPYGEAHFVVESDGQVLWVPPAHLQAFCKLGGLSILLLGVSHLQLKPVRPNFPLSQIVKHTNKVDLGHGKA